jgi:hypothetical protein
MTDEELKVIKARADSATPGPWKWVSMYGSWDELHGPYEDKVLDDGSASGEYSLAIDPESPDGVFVSAARTDVPALVEECLKRGERIADQKTEIQRLNGLLDAKRDDWHDDAG